MTDKKRIFVTSASVTLPRTVFASWGTSSKFSKAPKRRRKLIVEKVKSGINGLSLYRVRVRRKVLVPFLPLYS